MRKIPTINTTDDFMELTLVHTVYRTKMTKGEPVEVKHKEVLFKKWFLKDGLTSIGEYIGDNNKVLKGRSVIFDRYTGSNYSAYHSPGEIMNAKNGHKNQPIGYKC